MATLEEQVSALVGAANNLTDTVSGKMAEIDQDRAQLKSDFDAFMSDRERIGEGDPGTRRLNIFQAVMYNGSSVVPDSEKPEGWSPTNSNLYIHLKTKFNTLTKNGMFYFRIQGYAYGQSAIIDETVVGYSYKPQNNVINIGTYGNHSPIVYRAENGDVYIRLLATTLYYWSFFIDTMNVTGGLPEKGDIEMVVSPNEFLNNY